jgi:hypothetical protein
MPKSSNRNAIVGAITLTAIAVSFILAIRARDRVDVPLVIVAPVGTTVELDGDQPRELPQQPNTPNTLASYYFLTESGDHQIRFQEPGRPAREQSVNVPPSNMPVIFTLLRDTLREMKERSRR